MLDTKLVDLTVLDAYLAIAGFIGVVFLIAIAGGALFAIACALIEKIQRTDP